jgi:hypothetical protein
MFMQALLKFGTKCKVIHLAFFSVAMAKVVVGVCKGSRSKMTPKLLALCGEGK